MNVRAVIAIAAAFPLFGALAGVSVAETLFPTTLMDEELAPASVTLTLQTGETGSLAHQIGYLEDGTSFTVPIYFALDDTSISYEAQLVLAAFADEASVAPNVSITVSSHGYGQHEGATLGDMRAVNVFDALNTLGIPDRVMALELDENTGASLNSEVMASAI